MKQKRYVKSIRTEYRYVSPLFVAIKLLIHVVTSHQVIVEKVPRSTIPDIDKKKFLVPADLSGMPLQCNFNQHYNIV